MMDFCLGRKTSYLRFLQPIKHNRDNIFYRHDLWRPHGQDSAGIRQEGLWIVSFSFC